MSHVLNQNVQLRDDLAKSLANGRALEQRLEAVEGRLAEAHPAQSPSAGIQAAKSDQIPSHQQTSVRETGDLTASMPRRMRVIVRSGELWQPVFTNSEQRSVKVRIRPRAGSAEIKLALAGALDRPAGPPDPTWTLAGQGAEKWLRVGCGQEISARAEDTDIEVLVRQDSKPDLCGNQN